MINRKILKKKHWKKIDRVVSGKLQDLGFEFDSVLGMVDAEHDYYGCGHWGCAYPTMARGWVLKVTSDPIEGPIAWAIMQNEELRTHPGVVYILGVWRLKGSDMVAILREAVTPVDPYDLELDDHFVEALSNVQLMASEVNSSLRTGTGLLGTPRWDAIQVFENDLNDLGEFPRAEGIASFMWDFWKVMGGALADVNLHNLGVVEAGGPFKIFDVGHSKVNLEDYVPPLLPNPPRIPVI